MKNYALAVLILVTGCSTSLHNVTGLLMPPVSPEGVKVYHTMPVNSKIIGTVSVVSFSGVTLQNASNDALERIKLESGKLGANGIVIGHSDEEALNGAKVQGQAVFVSQ